MFRIIRIKTYVICILLINTLPYQDFKMISDINSTTLCDKFTSLHTQRRCVAAVDTYQDITNML